MHGRMRPDLRAYLLGDDGRRVFGPGPVDLLERVGELGSLRAAAMEMGRAYTKAPRLGREAERAFGFRLTRRTVGGSGGGGFDGAPAGGHGAPQVFWTGHGSLCAEDGQRRAGAGGLRPGGHPGARAPGGGPPPGKTVRLWKIFPGLLGERTVIRKIFKKILKSREPFAPRSV